MADEIEITDDPTNEADDQVTDESGQDTPPEEPVARAAFFEKKFEHEKQAKRDLQKDNKRLEGQVEEERTGKSYWHQEATRQQTRESVPDKQPDKQKDDAVDDAIEGFDLAELAVADDGGKRLLGIVEKRLEKKYKNHVSPEDVEAAIDRRLNTIVARGQLAERFPDLSDQNSDFTKQVNATAQRLAKDPMCKGMSEEATMRMAALEVETQFHTEGKTLERTNGERDKRISRQSAAGTRVGKPAAKESTELTDDQKTFARKAGISDAEYAKEA